MPSTTSRRMRITSRVVNIKRHTIGYTIGGKFHSTDRAKGLAARGRLSGVRVVGDHIQAKPGCRRLLDLPMKVRS